MSCFSKRLKQLRNESGLNQKELAQKLGVCHYTVSLWERGQRYPENKQFRKLSEFFGVSISYLQGTSLLLNDNEDKEKKVKDAYWKDLFTAIPQLSQQSQDLLHQNIEFFLKAEGLI